jgi:hypothetical protein
MRYRIIEHEKANGRKSYRVEHRFLLWWIHFSGKPRGDSIPGPILWFDTAEKAEKAFLGTRTPSRSTVVKDVRC